MFRQRMSNLVPDLLQYVFLPALVTVVLGLISSPDWWTVGGLLVTGISTSYVGQKYRDQK